MNVTCIIQARFASSRLPGKVLEQIGERSILNMVIDRVQRASTVGRIVVATSTEASDDAVEIAASEAGVDVVRGSQFDVLDRFHDVLRALPETDVVVRVTADCPFVDPGVLDLVVTRLIDDDLDFSANRLPPPYPRTYPVGLDVEACTAAALQMAWERAKEPHQREHVMPYLYENSQQFRIGLVDLDTDLSSYRWTVDTPEDLMAVRKIAELVGPEPFSWEDVLEVARSHPEIGDINRGAEQKSVTQHDPRWEQA